MFGRAPLTIRSWTAGTTAIAALVTLAGPASAYDRQTCDVMFGSANVRSIEQIAIEAGRADFGDELHLFGAPQGKAVICWSLDGRAAVKGRLYADDFRGPVEAIIEIRFTRRDGRVTNITRRSVLTNGVILGNREVEKVSPRGNFSRVRIELFTFRAAELAVPAERRRVASQTFRR